LRGISPIYRFLAKNRTRTPNKPEDTAPHRLRQPNSNKTKPVRHSHRLQLFIWGRENSLQARKDHPLPLEPHKLFSIWNRSPPSPPHRTQLQRRNTNQLPRNESPHRKNHARNLRKICWTRRTVDLCRRKRRKTRRIPETHKKQTQSRRKIRVQQGRSRHQNRHSRPTSPLRSLHRPHPKPSLSGRTNPTAKTVYHPRLHRSIRQSSPRNRGKKSHGTTTLHKKNMRTRNLHPSNTTGRPRPSKGKLQTELGHRKT